MFVIFSKLPSSLKFYYRLKLVTVLYTLQSYLSGLHGDLGQVYHAPFYFQDHSSVVFSIIQNVRNFKSVVSLSLKWVPLAKALRYCKICFRCSKSKKVALLTPHILRTNKLNLNGQRLVISHFHP